MKPEMTAAAHETYYWKRFFGKWDLSVANYYLGSFFKSRQKTDKFWRFLFFFLLKFIYSEKATKFCEISTVDLSYVVTVKSTVEILQNFVAFSEYMNFIYLD